jgi:hypothetical protein
MRSLILPSLIVGAGLLTGCFIGVNDGHGQTGTGNTGNTWTGPGGNGGENTGGTGGVGGTGGTGGVGGNTGGAPPAGSIVCDGAHGVEAGSPWPMEGCCADRRSRTPLVGPQNPKVAWQLDLGATLLTPPVIDDTGWIYVISADGNLHAVQPDGTPGWAHNFAPTTTTQSTPAIGEDGNLYFGAETGIFAVTLSGDPVWKFDAGGTKSSIAIGEDRTVYAYASTGTVYALAPDGTLKWKVDTLPWPSTSGEVRPRLALAADGSVRIGLHDGVLQTLSAGGVAGPMSAQLCMGPIEELALAGDGTVYAGCSGSLYAVSPGGDMVWNQGYTPARPALPAAGGVVFFSQDLRENSATGATLWTTSQYFLTTGVALDGDGFAYASANDESATVFRALRVYTDQGQPYWKQESDPASPLKAQSSPGTAVVDGVVYAPLGTTLWAFDSQ